MFTDIPTEQLHAVIDGIAEEILAECEITAPPVDAWVLAERLGMVVAADGWGASRARFVRLGGLGRASQPTILLADEPRPERRHWALAHEIGESRAYRLFEELRVPLADAAPGVREWIANRLANALLLPGRWFAEDGAAADWELFELKTRYSTGSHELIARRMLDMAPGVIVSAADHGRLGWRQSNRSSRTPPMTSTESHVWRMAHESGEVARRDEGCGEEGIVDVRAWPVHEPAWRREIVRTALTEGW